MYPTSAPRIVGFDLPIPAPLIVAAIPLAAITLVVVAVADRLGLIGKKETRELTWPSP